MAGMNDRIVTERKQHPGDRSHQHVVIAARKIRPADSAREERVAHEQVAVQLKAYTSRAVPRRVVDTHGVVAERDRVAAVKDVDVRRLRDLDAEQLSLLDGTLVERQVVPMQVDGRLERLLRLRDPGHVIEVGMRQQDVRDRQPVLLDEGDQLIRLVSRIDDDRLTRARTSHDKPVLEQWPDRARFKNHYHPVPDPRSLIPDP